MKKTKVISRKNKAQKLGMACVWLMYISVALPALAEEPRVLQIYNWADYVPDELLQGFEDETGIRVVYNMYESDPMLGAKLLAGRTGYDLVGMADISVQRFAPLGLFQPLDKSQLPNWKNLDPELNRRMAFSDPGNKYAVIYFWGSTGFAYNVEMIHERLPGAPLDSGAMIFDPEVVRHFEDCGVAFLDDGLTVVRMAMVYAGYHIDDTSDEAFEAAERVLKGVRPYIRYFESNRVAIDLPAGEVCLTMAWNGDYASGLKNAREEDLDIQLAYVVPSEGTNLWIDAWLIMADAPNPKLAYQFLDYLMRPEVMAAVSNDQRYPSGNLAAREFLIPEVIDDPAVTHTPEMMERIYQRTDHDLQTQRRVNRIWARVKAGFE